MIKTLLKSTALLLLAVAVAGPAAASTVTIDFGTVAAGSSPNSAAAAIAAGITFDGALQDYNYDAQGLPIPGSLHWVVDPTSPPTVENTSLIGWGTPASGSPNALDARLSPVLLHLDGPSVVNSFSFTLPNSTLGDLSGTQVIFLAADGSQLALFNYAQGVANTTYTFSSAVAGVTDILLASGTLYRSITLDATPVPLPAALPLLLSGLGLLGASRRRRSTVAA